MRKNSKGFMLAELIITSTVVVTAMVGLYANFNKIYSLYKERNHYFHLDGVYATRQMVNSFLKYDFNTFINSAFDTTQYYYIIQYDDATKKGNCTLDTTDANYNICQTLASFYHVRNMVILEYDQCILDPTSCGKTGFTVDTETFRDYISYITKYYNMKDSTDDYSYIVLTEILEDGISYYSNLRIR